MKPYGNKRKENQTCRYGCCTLRTVKTRRSPHVRSEVIRRSRKRARAEGRQACQTA